MTDGLWLCDPALLHPETRPHFETDASPENESSDALAGSQTFEPAVAV
jgi:hypothetical protein